MSHLCLQRLLIHSLDYCIFFEQAARFLERTTFGPKWDEIKNLGNQLESDGNKALAEWVKNQVSLPPTSHRAFFRKHLNPRAVESYIYGVPGPRACEKNAKFRRFAFTYKDMELSRGTSGDEPGNNGLPFTPLEIETIAIGSTNYYALKFNGDIRTISDVPLQYEDNGSTVTINDGKYTICHLDEVVGNEIGNETFDYQFQLLVDGLCESSYTNRTGVEDGKGDGARDTENIRVLGQVYRTYDRNQCNTKCSSDSNVKVRNLLSLLSIKSA